MSNDSDVTETPSITALQLSFTPRRRGGYWGLLLLPRPPLIFRSAAKAPFKHLFPSLVGSRLALLGRRPAGHRCLRLSSTACRTPGQEAASPDPVAEGGSLLCGMSVGLRTKAEDRWRR
jgi:hypothetical protein